MSRIDLSRTGKEISSLGRDIRKWSSLGTSVPCGKCLCAGFCAPGRRRHLAGGDVEKGGIEVEADERR